MPSTTPDVRRLVAAITSEATGASPRVCGSLRAHLEALADGELDSRLLEKRCGLNRDAKLGREARELGQRLGILSFRSRCLGMGKGQKSRVWFVRDGAQPPAAVGKLPSVLDRLSGSKLDILKRANGRLKLSSADWYDIARIIACVETSPRIAWNSIAIGQEIGRHYCTVNLKVQLGRKKRLFATQRYQPRGKKRQTVIRVNWPKLQMLAVGQTASDIAPAYRHAPIHERDNDRTPSDIEAILAAVDWRKTGLKTEHQWLTAKKLLPLLLKNPKARNADLASDLGGVCDTSVSNHCGRLREVGLIAHQDIYEVGRIGARANRTVMIERLKACAGEFTAASPTAGKLGAVQRSAFPPKAVGGRPTKWDHICDWVESNQSVDEKLPAALARYKRAFDDGRDYPTYEQLKIALTRRRNRKPR